MNCKSLIKNSKKLIICLIFSLNSVTLFGQSANYANGILPKVIQPLPDAAALGKFGNVPVGLFTGVPQISVPLYTIDVKGFSLPISVDYHASGVRVDEISSNVGLGWALNAGGMISCTINDIYDFDGSHGLYHFGDAIYSRYQDGTFASVLADPGGASGNADYIMIKDMANGAVDGEPDEFNFSFGWKSGKFVFDETQTVRTIPYEPLKIEFNQSNNSFLITDSKGIKYLFSDVEQSSIDPVTGSTCSGIDWFNSIANITPTWYLSTITTPTGDIISFNYSNVSYSYPLTDSETLYYQYAANSWCGSIPTPSDQRCKNEVNVQVGKRISSITSSKGHLIEFTYGTSSRLDLVGTNMLESVAVKYNGQLITSWELNHDYFVSSTSSSVPENYRLKLTSIQQDSKPPYSFEYNSTVLPIRNSADQDFWGYYNGAFNSGNSLVPEIRLESGITLPGANRQVNPLTIQAGILKKIIYPTSGSTEFVYEPNDYLFTGQERTFGSYSSQVLILAAQGTQSTTFTTGANVTQGNFVFQTNIPGISSLPPGDQVTAQLTGPSLSEYFETTSNNKVVALAPNTTYTLTLSSTTDGYYDGGFIGLNASLVVNWYGFIQQSVVKNLAAGGVRVAQSIDDTNDGAPPIIKTYVYKDETTPVNSSGYVINDPIHAFFQDFYAMDPSDNDNTIGPCPYVVRTSQSNAALSSIKSSSVGYEYVTVLNGAIGEGGKIVTKYMKYADLGDHHENVRGAVSEAFPTVYMRNTNYDFLRGLVSDESVYKNTGSSFIKVQQSVYSYEISDDITKLLPYTTAGANNKNILGLKAYMIKPELLGPLGQTLRGVFELLPHYYISNWYNLGEVQTTVYDTDGTQPVTNTTLYYHDNPAHAQLSRTVNINSQGVEQTVVSLFPQDYASGTTFIDDMKTAHLVSYPIEQTVYLTEGTAVRIVKGQLTQYFSGGKGLIQKNSELTAASPLPLSTYKFSNSLTGVLPFSSTNQTYTADGNFLETIAIEYDALGNIRQMTPKDGVSTTYLWSYKKQYPIAEIKNASYASVETALGGATAVDDFSNLVSPAKSQIDSFLSALYTPLPDAMISSFSYKPLIGIESQTDPKGMVTLYEYDTMHRLKNIKDQNGKIVKNFVYNYKQ